MPPVSRHLQPGRCLDGITLFIGKPKKVLGVDLTIANSAQKTLEKVWEVPKGEDLLDVKVIGHQWWWEYEYPDEGIVTANELHIPAGVPISLNLSATDVIRGTADAAVLKKLHGKGSMNSYAPGHP